MKLVRTLMIFCGLAATIRTQIVTIESVDTSENCSLFGSASITVLGCPNTVFTSPADGSCISNDAGGYQVVLSKSMIEEQTPIDYESMDGQSYSIIKRSKESDQNYPDAVIVVETDKPFTSAATQLIQTVQRYWYDKGEDHISKETVLSLTSDAAKITDIQVVDGFAVYLEGNAQECPSIQSMGPAPNANGLRGRALKAVITYDQIDKQDTTIIADGDVSEILSFDIQKKEDIEGDQYELVVIVMSQTANGETFSIKSYDVSYESEQLSVKLKTSKILEDDYLDISTIEMIDNYLILGCSTCNESQGWLRFYENQTLILEKEYEGVDILQANCQKSEAKSIDGISSYLRCFYSSQDQNFDRMSLNALVFSQANDGKIIFDDGVQKNEIVQIPLSSTMNVQQLDFQIAGEDIFYKVSSSSELLTIKSCDLNQKQSILEDGPILNGRLCEPCPASSPYSLGFQGIDCTSCDQLQGAELKLCINLTQEQPENDSDEQAETDSDDNNSNQTNFKSLRPLDEPEFDLKPYYMFAILLIPFLLIYVCITCYCRNLRKQRLVAEQKERANKQKKVISQGAFAMNRRGTDIQQQGFDAIQETLSVKANTDKNIKDTKMEKQPNDPNQVTTSQPTLRNLARTSTVPDSDTEYLATERAFITEAAQKEVIIEDDQDVMKEVQLVTVPNRLIQASK